MIRVRKGQQRKIIQKKQENVWFTWFLDFFVDLWVILSQFMTPLIDINDDLENMATMIDKICEKRFQWVLDMTRESVQEFKELKEF